GAPGLIRKYYLFGQDQVGGGVYFVAEPRSCREDVLPGVEEDDHGAVRRPTRDLLLRDASDRGTIRSNRPGLRRRTARHARQAVQERARSAGLRANPWDCLPAP